MKKALRIWKQYYEYNRRFLKDLRREILRTSVSMQNSEKPQWIVVTEKLEKALGY